MATSTLRQGAVVIAIVDILLSATLLFLLVLGSTHAQEMSAMLDADMMDTDSQESELNRINNETRMHTARHLATATIVTLYAVIALVTVHLISSISLLCGVILRIRELMVPWTCFILVFIVLTICLLSTAVWMRAISGNVFLFGSLFLQVYICLWGVVCKYYRALCNEEFCNSYQNPADSPTETDKLTTIKAININMCFPHDLDKPQSV